MKIAVTGATGFLGRHLIDRLLTDGHKVSALVESGVVLPDRWLEAAVQVTQGDLKDDHGESSSLLPNAEVFIHLAALGVQSRDREWKRMIEVNVVDPQGWITSAKRHGVRLAVAAGTSLEYRGFGTLPDNPWPKEKPIPLCDENSPLGSRDGYGASKAAGGVLLCHRAEVVQLPLWYLRFASLYGLDDDPQKFIPAVIRAAREGIPFKMTAGEQVRDWLHVDDAVEAIAATLSTDTEDAARVLNIGTGVDLPLVEIAKRFFEEVGGGKIADEVLPYRASDAHVLVLDPRSARENLNWAPRYKRPTADSISG